MIDDITTVFKFHWGKYCMLEVRERYEELSTLLFPRLRVIIPNADASSVRSRGELPAIQVR
jgi:hypothetical protein